MGRGRKTAAESVGFLYGLKGIEVGMGGRFGGGFPYLKDSEGTSRRAVGVVERGRSPTESRSAQALHNRAGDTVLDRAIRSITRGMLIQQLRVSSHIWLKFQNSGHSESHVVIDWWTVRALSLPSAMKLHRPGSKRVDDWTVCSEDLTMVSYEYRWAAWVVIDT